MEKGADDKCEMTCWPVMLVPSAGEERNSPRRTEPGVGDAAEEEDEAVVEAAEANARACVAHADVEAVAVGAMTIRLEELPLAALLERRLRASSRIGA